MVNEVAQEKVDSINEPNLNEAADTEVSTGKCCCVCIGLAICIGLLIYTTTSFIEEIKSHRLHFSLDIVSIEGLSPSSSCHTCTTISPTFTLDFNMDNSHNHLHSRCFLGGETTVFYQLVEIAAGPIGEFCVGKSGKKDLTVHAWSLELELPVFLREQLYEETKNHTAVFDVELSLYEESKYYPLIVDFRVGYLA
ncbi:hypothetical protein LUZ63_015790 [Rhynchospora breviuscula]|uniref:Uncharacterized protein n=1 Tax=Rhynchospora breviuscula TaxID=2022672 RepID=A0A9Q0HN50_9POAL|nr:hypothetical protein LUZ63_015790 [Rhynchospora breviuscula]